MEIRPKDVCIDKDYTWGYSSSTLIRVGIERSPRKLMQGHLHEREKLTYGLSFGPITIRARAHGQILLYPDLLACTALRVQQGLVADAELRTALAVQDD